MNITSYNRLVEGNIVVDAVTTKSIYVEESATLIPSFTAAMIHSIVRPLSSSRGHMVS